jgi:tRNA-dihydrouridine synthase
MRNIWRELDKPIWCLAPMEAVTDTVFRRVMVKLGKPDVMFTEFTNVEGMFSAGDEQVRQRLLFTQEERPLIAQIWGMKPELYEQAGKLLVGMGFDGVDINLGCPDKHVIKKGGCSALVNDKPLVREIIEATKAGVAGQIPVSVKIRTGLKRVETEEWVEWLLTSGIEALTVHGRTAKEMSKVPCDWNEIGKAVQVRDSMKVETVVIGNGDVMSLGEAEEKVKGYGVDGVMIGRGVFHDPWLFASDLRGDSGHAPPSGQPSRAGNYFVRERLEALLYHVRLWYAVWDGETKGERYKRFDRLKRFFKIYVQGFPGAVELRGRLMETSNREEVEAVVGDQLSVVSNH